MEEDSQGALVSVVIPAHNAAGTLPDTLASARAQSYSPLEILVVDDGSTDGTAALVEAAASQDSRIRLIRQPNSGVAAARNAGIAAARGAFVAPLDADDLWHPEKIALQMAVFARSTEPLGFVYAWSRRVDARGCVGSDQGEPRLEGDVFADLLTYNFINNASTALLRRRSILAAGGFDATLRQAGAQGAEDIALYLAIAEREAVGVAPYYLVGYRQMPGTMSSGGTRMRRSLSIVLDRIEDRRPDLPARLFALAHMHYDLYAASLGLNARDLRLFAGMAGRGLRRAPALALSLLGCAALWRLAERVVPRSCRSFGQLAPMRRFRRLPLQHWLERRRIRAVQEALEAHRPPAGMRSLAKSS